MSRVVVYLRVSSDRQDAANQRRDVEGILPVGCRPEWVVESGSAWKDDGLRSRPEFQRIYGLVKRGVIDRLYVWDLDRLYRRRKSAVAFLRLAKERGCVVVSFRQSYLSEVLKAPEPWNEIIYDLIIQILASIAEEESSKKSDRIKAAFANSKHPERWGRPKVVWNERRAYHLIFVEGVPLRKVAEEVGVSLGTIARSKKVWSKNPPSFIKE